MTLTQARFIWEGCIHPDACEQVSNLHAVDSKPHPVDTFPPYNY